MNIAFTYNVRHVKPDINDSQYIKEAEFDEPSTIYGIVMALEGLGHKVYQIEADEKAYGKFKKLKNEIDLVFNFSEGLHGADREAQIPAILEMLQIPYTGPKPLTHALVLNKSRTKEILAYNQIATAKWMVAKKISDLGNCCLSFPIIAKPLGEGSSKGITADCLVHDFVELRRITKKILNNFSQPVLLEEFLPGREFTVAIIGNPPQVMPIIEIKFDDLPPGMPKFDHYQAKWIYDNLESKKDLLVCPATISAKLQKQIKEMCLHSFNILEIVDWARFDVRLDKNGIPNIIEVNCPPGIIPDPKENSRFPRAARVGGLDFASMLKLILKSACYRYNLKYTIL
jgi:D-alanine-D-alanine ligase